MSNSQEEINLNTPVKTRGRPRKQSLSKLEYNKKWVKDHYEERKEIVKETATKNSNKYRECYKLLKQIYENDNEIIPDKYKEEIIKLIDTKNSR
jgi:hypothetical protein